MTRRVPAGKRWAKALLRGMERRLPAQLHVAFSASLFQLYKAAVRARFASRVWARRFLHDTGEDAMGRCISAVLPYTLVGVPGLEATYRLAQALNDTGVEGDFIELGVARGGCAALLGSVCFQRGAPHRQLWLFDSFEGLPAPTAADLVDGETGTHIRSLPPGSCLGTVAEVERLLFRNWQFPPRRVHLVQGWFENTLPRWSGEVGPVALLRIDGDWYESTKCCLEHLFDKVVAGGAVIVDDYESCYGCKKAVDEFLQARGLLGVVEVRLDGRGGCFFFKP